ncbi:type II toxin-antitoxin system VapC family toxin [Nostocaceae cyanobacterium CENA357]|uniref:Type II toxin-antitoxin system VapC family toxin n=1 Tax=Atlanticothrix silvestris CENA357 TaxID=1725252 RepID=A0A8J7L3W6_9CYAN|nr:type II toxin-antitoxin system VapC family toxin [Atlanticothrix silvestris]MBH8555350.1 type II toxin-antitoxin system VapC family toxin [Atlanticothrix silvestris CENA357]
MSLYILDTDHVSFLLQGNQTVISKVAQVYPHLAITIVTVQEIFNGWVVKINDRAESGNLVNLYTKLWTTQEYFKGVRILNFDTAAYTCYQGLLRENQQLNKKRLQKDLRIAAIAISISAVMVTRNQKDFSQIPNLVLEDWTK